MTPVEPGVSMTADGAWCWFQDPRAVFVAGERIQTIAGWVTRKGTLQIGAYDHAAGTTFIVTLNGDWGGDDHNTCSILVLPDNRLIVFYAKHNGTGLFCRSTVSPEDIREWHDEVSITGTRRVTYSHPVYLADEKRFYVFWRGETWKPTFSVSDDGTHWSEPRILLCRDDGDSTRIRPYLKLVSDGKSSIHFTFTDGHPRNEPTNSIYYFKYARGAIQSASGEVIGSLSRLPLRQSAADVVYDARETGARAWVWDIALHSDGSPVIAYTRHPGEDDHRYHHALWDGSGWYDNEVTAAGPWFPQTAPGETEKEPHYSGGIAFKHADPSTLYLSRQVAGQFEIERWTTRDGGANWTCKPITLGSRQLNVRPLCPRGFDLPGDHVLWIRGGYRHYTDFNTAVVGILPD